MVKLTKRKGFNFFRSYYDVYNELETDREKVAFIEALLDRQFLGIKPTELKGMAKFAYISQTNSIDSQVKGYEDKTGIILNPTDGDSNTPTDGGKITPTIQVEEKGEVEEKEKVKKEVTPLAIFTFSEFWSLYPHKVAKDKCEPKYEKLSNSDKVKIKSTLNNFLAIKPFAEYNHPNPLTYLNQKRWNDEVKKENSTFAPANPENEEIVTYYDNVNPTRRQITRSKFELMKVRNAEGGYIYSEVPQR